MVASVKADGAGGPADFAEWHLERADFMRKKLWIAVPILCCLSVLATDKSELEARCAHYHQNGKAIVEMALLKKVNAADVEKRVGELVTDAVWMGNEYAKTFPAGAKIIKAVIDNVENIKKLPYEEIEKEWHDLGHFSKPGNDPGIDMKNEDNEHFTDPLHAIIHPLMVLKAAQNYAKSKDEKELKQIKEEMEEGMEQEGKLKAKLSK